jgi:menaquinone-dependent protoporphyrinogen IX oxidase
MILVQCPGMTAITVAYGTRFGATAKLAQEIAAGLQSVGAVPQLIDVARGSPTLSQPLVLLSAIIWDRPVPAMREWIKVNRRLVRQFTVACGVVCGSAGVREKGGLVYARQLAKHIDRPDIFQFALSGEIPARNRMQRWEWCALQLFSTIARKPQLFRIRADVMRANEIGREIGTSLFST